mmetsp:Transcript_31269/g.75593  ORF Transcript_31269/g.75593 Transcript_31269/m.75593 type:complete len:338 (-) Transcript_31269:285-1298(-)
MHTTKRNANSPCRAELIGDSVPEEVRDDRQNVLLGLGDLINLVRNEGKGRVAVPHHFVRSRHHHCRHRRTVLGHETGGLTRLGETDDEPGSNVNCIFCSAAEDSLKGTHGLRCEVTKKEADLVVIDSELRILGDVRHRLHSTIREGPVGSLPGKHHAVRPVKHSVRNVRHLRARREGVAAHGLEHLSSRDDKRSSNIALGDDHLLCQSDLLRRNLHPKVPASNHDAVRLGNNRINVFQPCLVLDLADDLNIRTPHIVERLADELDIVPRLHKRRRHIVHLVLHAEVLQVVNVLLRQHGDVHLHPREVAVLALSKLLRVEHRPLEHRIAHHLLHLDHN